MEYVVWDTQDEGNSCSVRRLEGISDTFQLLHGVPRAATLDTPARYYMDSTQPRALGLTDSLINTDSFLVISEKLKRFLEVEGGPSLEFLPVEIVNHKGRVAAQYFICHPVAPQDCLDLAGSRAKTSAVDPGTVLTIKRLVIDPSRIDAGLRVFRVQRLWEVVLVERALAEAISDAGFRGIAWVELDDYAG